MECYLPSVNGIKHFNETVIFWAKILYEKAGIDESYLKINEASTDSICPCIVTVSNHITKARLLTQHDVDTESILTKLGPQY